MTYYVYAVCFVGGRGENGDGRAMQIMHQGTRRSCAAYIRDRVRNHMPIHFLRTSVRTPAKARRAFL